VRMYRKAVGSITMCQRSPEVPEMIGSRVAIAGITSSTLRRTVMAVPHRPKDFGVAAPSRDRTAAGQS
jgi:hypothetical protein